MDNIGYEPGWCPICGDPEEVCNIYGTCWEDQLLEEEYEEYCQEYDDPEGD